MERFSEKYVEKFLEKIKKDSEAYSKAESAKDKVGMMLSDGKSFLVPPLSVKGFKKGSFDHKMFLRMHDDNNGFDIYYAYSKTYRLLYDFSLDFEKDGTTLAGALTMSGVPAAPNSDMAKAQEKLYDIEEAISKVLNLNTLYNTDIFYNE